MMTKENLELKIKTCQERVNYLDGQIAKGMKLTNFGSYVYDSDKKDIAKYKKQLEYFK